jgi:hypothetical protein
MLLALIVKYGKPLGLVLLVAGLIGYRAILVSQRDSARQKLRTAQAQVAILQVANQQMQQAVSRQNAAIASLRAEQEHAAATARAEQETAQVRSADIMQSTMKQSAALIKASVPEDCTKAIAWGNAQGPELAKW